MKRKQKRKLITSAVSLTLLLALTACGGGSDTAQSDSSVQEEADADLPAEEEEAEAVTAESEQPNDAEQADDAEKPAQPEAEQVSSIGGYHMTSGTSASAASSFQPEGLWYTFSYVVCEFDLGGGTVTLYDQGGSANQGSEKFVYDAGTGEMVWGEGENEMTGTVMVNEHGVLCLTGEIAEKFFELPAVVMAGEGTFDGNGRWYMGFMGDSQPQAAMSLDAEEGMTIYSADDDGKLTPYLKDWENVKFGWLEDSGSLITFTDDGVVSNEWAVEWVDGLGVTVMAGRYTLLAQAPEGLTVEAAHPMFAK